EPVLSRLPGTSSMVAGAVNHRGQVLVVADPVRALDLPGGSGGARDVVVVEVGGRRLALALDAVIELVTETRTGLATMDLEAIAMAVFG
ncbi:MAG TPA: chemotaxis protein CheW, partial [Gemmatimonadales bacterium]|nr:chemotaxis protein CheW [Gemmatimonadales bacterium]